MNETNDSGVAIDSTPLLGLICNWENEAAEYDELADTSTKNGRLTSCALHRGRGEMMRKAAADLKSLLANAGGQTPSEAR